MREHKTASGANFYDINPKGNVPAIVLDDGTVLNENVACLMWIAEQANGKVGGTDSSDRYLLLQALSFIASEAHQAIGGLFHPGHTAESKAFYNLLLEKRLGYIENELVKGKKFVVGNSFTVADAYLYIVLTWCAYVNVDLTNYPNTREFIEGIKSLDNVQGAHARIATSPSTTF